VLLVYTGRMSKKSGCICGTDEPDYPDEPEEGDWQTQDHEKFYSYGKLILRVSPDASTAEMWKAIRVRMDKDGFWPNVWFISDHGNWHLMVPEMRRRRR